MRFATKTDSTTPSSTHFAAYDGNGNVMALVDGSTGVTSARYEYDPFGQTIRASGTIAALNPVRFSSKHVDEETDLAYYGYRYLNPNSGRWLSRDSIGEADGPNLYSFIRNKSTKGVDPRGIALRDDEIRRSINGEPPAPPAPGCQISGITVGYGLPCILKWECESYRRKYGNEILGEWFDTGEIQESYPVEDWYWESIASKCFRRAHILQAASVHQWYENVLGALLTQRFECGRCPLFPVTLGALLSTEVTRAALTTYELVDEGYRYRERLGLQEAEGIAGASQCEALNSTR